MNKTICKTLNQVIAYGTSQLEKANISNPKLETELLLSYLLSSSRFDLYFKGTQLTDELMSKFEELLLLRAERYPLQYITGQTNFMGLDFIVNPNVLIPRPETEILVEKAIDIIADSGLDEVSILDIGTGAGNIAISLTKYISKCKIWATDISPEALVVARNNAWRLGVEDKIIFVLSNIWPSAQEKNEKFDLIISNPPYIARNHFEGLPPEVKHEPILALAGGEKGLDFYYKIITQGVNYLNKNGYLILELGDNQVKAVREIVDSVKELIPAQVFKDLNNRERVILTSLK